MFEVTKSQPGGQHGQAKAGEGRGRMRPSLGWRQRAPTFEAKADEIGKEPPKIFYAPEMFGGELLEPGGILLFDGLQSCAEIQPIGQRQFSQLIIDQ